ncbi:MAG TPA: LptF/LptG family permease [Balneolaceae bacterium]|nr:LptF/LptG family permease [Balneolaceae bacterium]
MLKKLDQYIFTRLLAITVFVLAVLIFIFIVIHFSDHSEEFTDNGATLKQVFTIYYPNYIPEIIRLVTPVAVFIACLYLTGQMADRLEITALKAAGVSLYRLLVPYLLFAFFVIIIISYLDGFIVPKTNARRLEFAQKYLNRSVNSENQKKIYRQESSNTLLKINYYNAAKKKGHKIEFYKFKGDSVKQTTTVRQMTWRKKSNDWHLANIERRIYTKNGFKTIKIDSVDTTLNVLPRDLARKTSDISQLTYPEAANYIQSIRRSGAGSIDPPKVQFYGRLVYPISILVVCIIGFAIASEKRRGGKGFYIFIGLATSFIFLALMKIIQPFGSEGLLTPLLAVLLPHLLFLLIGIALLMRAPK